MPFLDGVSLSATAAVIEIKARSDSRQEFGNIVLEIVRTCRWPPSFCLESLEISRFQISSFERQGSRVMVASVSTVKRWKLSNFALPRPEPAESSGGQQGIDESVDYFLDHVAPGIASPNTITQVPQAIGEECGGTDHAKDRQITETGRDGVGGEISDEEGDYQAVAEPQGGRAAGGWRERPAGCDYFNRWQRFEQVPACFVPASAWRT